MERRSRDSKMNYFSLALFLAGIILIAGCGSKGAAGLGPDQVGLKFPDGYFIKAEVADTKTERETGLSGRESLAEDAGMWFVFEDDGRYPFWMRGMKFGIDIIWIDREFKVVEIAMNAMPESGTTLKSYVSQSPARYVLEVAAGTAKTHKLGVGDIIELISS